MRLQFRRQLLGLLEQAFGLHRGLDAVQHDADASGELFQEGQLRSRERAQRSQFNHRLHPILEEYGQHNYVSRDRSEQSGTDRHRLVRQVCNQHAPLFCGHLPDEALAQTDSPQVAGFRIICECG